MTRLTANVLDHLAVFSQLSIRAFLVSVARLCILDLSMQFGTMQKLINKDE